MSGKVYLCGAGPGDPELITLKAKRVLKESDVILYDRLSNNDLLKYSSADTELFYVGKKANHHHYSQSEINNLLVKKAEEGKKICRLKGGDPFVFGRGGEEATILNDNGIDFEIIPGISSSLAVPSYAGIPVTHRNISSSFAVITGHEAANKKESSVQLEKIANSVDTLIILMGVSKLSNITERLIESGFEVTTPVSLCRWGTRVKQKTITGNLEDIVKKAAEVDFRSPAVIIIGEVVKKREELKWFENKELFGKRILVTRPAKQADKFCKILERKGAKAIRAPMIEIKEPDDFSDLDRAISNLDKYKWIVFTSVNGVEKFMNRLFINNQDCRELKGIKTVVIGKKTAQKLKEYGIKSDYMPVDYSTQGILSGIKDYAKENNLKINDSFFLLPRADIAPKTLEKGLQNMGAKVNNIEAYRNVIPKINKKYYRMLYENELDLLTFTSSSTVLNFIKGMEDYLERDINLDINNEVKVACIGPVTAKTARESGIEVDIIAEEYTIDGLYKAIIDYYKKR